LRLNVSRPAVPVFLSPQAESFQLTNAPMAASLFTAGEHF
jgi:hypothetical protein